MDISLTDLPEKYHPAIDELPRDMMVLASGLEKKFKGKGVLIALAISEIFSGQELYIAQIKEPLRKWRNDQIRIMYDRGGVTVKELARIWGISKSSAERIVSQPMEIAE